MKGKRSRAERSASISAILSALRRLSAARTGTRCWRRSRNCGRWRWKAKKENDKREAMESANPFRLPLRVELAGRLVRSIRVAYTSVPQFFYEQMDFQNVFGPASL